MYAITNPPPGSEIFCLEKNSTKLSNLTSLGAIIVHVPCECEIRIPGHRAIQPIFPCLAEDPELTQYHAIPARWSALNSFIVPTNIPEHLPSYLDINDCFDKDWMNRSMDDLSFTSMFIPPPTMHETLWNNVQHTSWGVLVWLIFISACAVYLIIRERQISHAITFYFLATKPQPAQLTEATSLYQPPKTLASQTQPNTCQIPVYIEWIINLIFLLLIVKYAYKLLQHLYVTLWVQRHLRELDDENEPSHRTRAVNSDIPASASSMPPIQTPLPMPLLHHPLEVEIARRYKSSSRHQNKHASDHDLAPHYTLHANPLGSAYNALQEARSHSPSTSSPLHFSH